MDATLLSGVAIGLFIGFLIFVAGRRFWGGIANVVAYSIAGLVFIVAVVAVFTVGEALIRDPSVLFFLGGLLVYFLLILIVLFSLKLLYSRVLFQYRYRSKYKDQLQAKFSFPVVFFSLPVVLSSLLVGLLGLWALAVRVVFS